tara:strand:+ start:147 stop:440 length:294 start_codon:yes stop_codon:yes gene_type:complete
MDFKGTNSNTFLKTAATPFKQSPTAGGHFFKAKGFAQYVIRTVIEQTHNGFSAAAGCQHNHRTAQLLAKSQGRTLLQEFSTHQQVRRLLLAKLNGFK